MNVYIERRFLKKKYDICDIASIGNGNERRLTINHLSLRFEDISLWWSSTWLIQFSIFRTREQRETSIISLIEHCHVDDIIWQIPSEKTQLVRTCIFDIVLRVVSMTFSLFLIELLTWRKSYLPSQISRCLAWRFRFRVRRKDQKCNWREA